MKKLVLVFTVGLGLFSCNQDAEVKDNSKNPVEEFKYEEQDCKYRINVDKIQANWTAFKLTEKVGVNGSFQAIAIDPNVATSPEGILEGLHAAINTSSVNTTDEARDKKIVNSFFHTMADSSQITAVFSNVTVTKNEENNVAGTVDIDFKMNGVNATKSAKFKYNGSIIKVIGEVNVNDFNAANSLEELNKVCEEKHKGEGDEAVTWPDVKFSLSAVLIKVCK